MRKGFARSFSTFSKVYANSLEKHLIKEDPCQQNVVRYLDRFQDILEQYQRGPIPNVRFWISIVTTSMRS